MPGDPFKGTAGPAYEAPLDAARLTDQHLRIKGLMLDGQWRTLDEISAQTGDPPASISAQLRHLRKARFGGYTLEKRRRGVKSKGLFEYRVLPPTEVPTSGPERIDWKDRVRTTIIAIEEARTLGELHEWVRETRDEWKVR